jgi:Na+-driven multidrug efflux pump
MVVSITSMLVFRIVLSYILGVRLGWGAIGVWIAMIVDWFCRIVCFSARYLSGKWKIYAVRV